MKSVSEKPSKLTRQFMRDRQWVAEHMHELVEKYPDQWVLVHEGKVIASGVGASKTWANAEKLGLGQPYLRFIERGVHVY